MTTATTRGSGRAVPHSLEAEEALLGSMMLSRSAIEDAAAFVVAADFYKPSHAVIYEAILGLYNTGTTARAGEPMLLEALAGSGISKAALLQLEAETPASANAGHYARLVVQKASLRRLIAAAGDIATLAYEQTLDPAAVVIRAGELIANAEVPAGGSPDVNVVEFLAQSHDYEWAVPGLLEVMDRLLLVAPEKYGKSTLIRQMAVTLSQGLHPFRFHSIPACNVLLVDCENPAPLIRRKLGPLLANCENTLHRQLEADRLRIVSRPEGIDITRRADELWLQDRVAANRARWEQLGWGGSPIVLCIGPIYKLHDAEDEKAADARKVQKALDRIRARYRATLIMETHAPHESFAKQSGTRALRPAGSRVWLRWPEFCRAIQPAENGDVGVADFYDSQGARDERDWPFRLRKGGKWPWEEHDIIF